MRGGYITYEGRVSHVKGGYKGGYHIPCSHKGRP